MFQVLMKDITTPVPPEEMKNLVKKCLEKAATVNYSQLMEYAQVKGKGCHHLPPYLNLKTQKIGVISSYWPLIMLSLQVEKRWRDFTFALLLIVYG